MRLLRGVGIVIVMVLVGVGIVAGLARLHDGPVGILAGGPFETGELVTAPVTDWSFAKDIREVELQLLDPDRSRTVWIVVHEGEAYVPCGFLDLPLWKQWPHEAERDGRAILRMEDKLYERQAVRVTEPAVYQSVLEEAARKYGFDTGAEPDPESVWVFRLEPRREG
jgi:hypothetical protein